VKPPPISDAGGRQKQTSSIATEVCLWSVVHDLLPGLGVDGSALAEYYYMSTEERLLIHVIVIMLAIT
jgi:hypothetical protein